MDMKMLTLVQDLLAASAMELIHIYTPNFLSFVCSISYNGTKFISICILVVLQDIRRELGITVFHDQQVQLSKVTAFQY